MLTYALMFSDNGTLGDGEEYANLDEVRDIAFDLSAETNRRIAICDDDSMIKRVSQKGYAPNGWPILEVEFGNIDIAKGFTAVYLACPDADDEEVLEYLGIRELVVA